MKIKDVMNIGVISIDKEANTFEAFEKMNKTEIRRLFVLDGDEVLGVISYSDLIGALNNKNNINETIENFMTKDVMTIDANEGIENAANLMVRADISGLLVQDKGKNVGVITKTDICRLVAAKFIVPKE